MIWKTLLSHDEHLPRIRIEGGSSHIDRPKDALPLGKLRYQIKTVSPKVE